MKKKNILWKYCIDKKIDIARTEIENKNNDIDNGFGESGYIIQLFSIFKNKINFCLKEQRNENCQICNHLKIFDEEYHNIFLSINESSLKFNNIQNILSYNLIFNGLTNCENCNLGDNFPTCNIFYTVSNYPNFIFILFDLPSYSQMKINYKEICKLLVEEIIFTDKDKYILKGCITSPYHNHFTFYINNLYIKDELEEINNNINYYYDSNKFNNLFLEVKSIKDLIINDDYFVIPYLAIYSKINA